jgi:hypothetical protein
MSPDPMIRVLLGLILACLVILVIQGFGSDEGTPAPDSLAGAQAAADPEPSVATPDPAGEENEKRAKKKKRKKDKKKPIVQIKPPASPPLPKPRPVQVNPQTEIEALSHALSPENPQSIRVWAAEQLGTQSDVEAVSVLTETLGDSDTRVVVAAIRALRDSKDPGARGAIEPMLQHQDASVKQAAEQALATE